MRNLLVGAVAALLVGCATAVKIESGQHTVGARLVFNLDGAWNQINAPGLGAAQVWTMEGLPIDQLLVYSGIKDGEDINANTVAGSRAAERKPFSFRASMQPDEIVSLFERMLTRDGSTFRLVKLQPASFAGGKGFRFEYGVTRKVDGAQLSGLGYGIVDQGELFAIVYIAPRLTFFSRHQARVERMAAGAKLKL